MEFKPLSPELSALDPGHFPVPSGGSSLGCRMCELTSLSKGWIAV